MPETEDQEAFLKQPNVAVLATVDAQGRPHAAPIWYLYDDGVIVMSTGRGSQKHRNIERNPNVTLVVDRRTVPYYALMLHGEVEVGPRLSDEDRRRMAERYLGEELARAYLARTSGEDSVSLRLRPRRIVEFRGRAGRRE